MSRKNVIEFIQISNNYIEALDRQAEHYYEQCRLLRQENIKLKEGKKFDDVIDDTEKELLEKALKQLDKISKNLDRRKEC